MRRNSGDYVLRTSKTQLSPCLLVPPALSDSYSVVLYPSSEYDQVPQLERIVSLSSAVLTEQTFDFLASTSPEDGSRLSLRYASAIGASSRFNHLETGKCVPRFLRNKTAGGNFEETMFFIRRFNFQP